MKEKFNKLAAREKKMMFVTSSLLVAGSIFIFGLKPLSSATNTLKTEALKLEEDNQVITSKLNELTSDARYLKLTALQQQVKDLEATIQKTKADIEKQNNKLIMSSSQQQAWLKEVQTLENLTEFSYLKTEPIVSGNTKLYKHSVMIVVNTDFLTVLKQSQQWRSQYNGWYLTSLTVLKQKPPVFKLTLTWVSKEEKWDASVLQ